MNKRVCMLVHNYYSTDPRVRREASALIEHGYSVDVIALQESKNNIRFDLDGVSVYQLPLRKTRESIFRYLITYACVFVLGMVMVTVLYARKRYDLIQIHNMPNFIVFTSIIPKLCGARVLLDIHDPMPELFMSKFSVDEDSVPIKLLKLEEKVSMRFADRVITATEMVRQRLVQALDNVKEVDVILNLPDKKKININTPVLQKRDDDKFVLLYHGTIAKRHGLGIVVQALPEIKKSIPNVEFMIIGNGEYTEELREMVEQLNLEDTVVFKDPIPHEEIASEILMANAVICVPATDVFIEMALSTKVLETLALHKPVIISKNKCNQYYFNDDEVFFVDPSKLESIVSVVKHLHQVNLNKNKSEDSIYLRIKDKFNWDLEKLKYLRIVQEMT